MNITQRIRRISATLWRDQNGNLSWLGLILVTLITAFGVIVGLSTYRDHVLQQFGDAAVALRNLRQTYKYEVQIDANGNGLFSDAEDCVLQGSFEDVVDLFDEPNSEPACMQLEIAPSSES